MNVRECIDLPLAVCTDKHNKEVLEAIEKSVFLLCLDRPPVPSTQAPSVMESPTNSVTARQCVHGDGSQSNSGNRWFDKTCQVGAALLTLSAPSTSYNVHVLLNSPKHYL